LGELHPAAVALAQDVDLLIHDAQYTGGELPALAFLGHSCPEYAISLAAEAGARQVCLFPTRPAEPMTHSTSSPPSTPMVSSPSSPPGTG
jgi:ribonuclease BN (tRNA processing enzyme)